MNRKILSCNYLTDIPKIPGKWWGEFDLDFSYQDFKNDDEVIASYINKEWNDHEQNEEWREQGLTEWQDEFYVVDNRIVQKHARQVMVFHSHEVAKRALQTAQAKVFGE